MQDLAFEGRHYETGTVVNALRAMGCRDPFTGEPYSEALALGASGGIAFGYFTFSYRGQLPHVSLLTRNTFDPMDRMLDNLGVRREERQTTKPERSAEMLRAELDKGNPVIVFPDRFSLPYRQMNAAGLWIAMPIVVIGYEGNTFFVADGSSSPIPIDGQDLQTARAKIIKDRFRMQVLQAPDEEVLSAKQPEAMATCVDLALDTPPAGSVNNFGIAGMRAMAKALTAKSGPKAWSTVFATPEQIVQALAGKFAQPGVWDWIERWGTGSGADRRVYAAYLREVHVRTGNRSLQDIAALFDQSADRWQALAAAAMPGDVPGFTELLRLKNEQEIWFTEGPQAAERLARNRDEAREWTTVAAQWPGWPERRDEIQRTMAGILEEIAAIEEPAFRTLRD